MLSWRSRTGNPTSPVDAHATAAELLTALPYWPGPPDEILRLAASFAARARAR